MNDFSDIYSIFFVSITLFLLFLIINNLLIKYNDLINYQLIYDSLLIKGFNYSKSLYINNLSNNYYFEDLTNNVSYGVVNSSITYSLPCILFKGNNSFVCRVIVSD